jgi:hypothetical protein
MSSGVQQSVHLPQPAQSTVELSNQEPGASVYAPLALSEEAGNTAPALESGSGLDDQPTITASREKPE